MALDYLAHCWSGMRKMTRVNQKPQGKEGRKAACHEKQIAAPWRGWVLRPKAEGCCGFAIGVQRDSPFGRLFSSISKKNELIRRAPRWLRVLRRRAHTKGRTRLVRYGTPAETRVACFVIVALLPQPKDLRSRPKASAPSPWPSDSLPTPSSRRGRLRPRNTPGPRPVDEGLRETRGAVSDRTAKETPQQLCCLTAAHCSIQRSPMTAHRLCWWWFRRGASSRITLVVALQSPKPVAVFLLTTDRIYTGGARKLWLSQTKKKREMYLGILDSSPLRTKRPPSNPPPPTE